MKKTYQKPEIETTELHLHAAIMSAIGGNEQPDWQGTPEHPAPRRRVF